MRLDNRILNVPIDAYKVMTNPALISMTAADGFEMLDVQRGNADYDSCYPREVVEREPKPLNCTDMDYNLHKPSPVRHIDPNSYNLKS